MAALSFNSAPPCSDHAVSPVRRTTPSVFWIFFLLALATMRSKSICLGYGMKFRPWLWEMLLLCHWDILFAMGSGLVAQAAIWLLRPWPRVQRTWWICCIVFGMLGSIYAIASIPMLIFLRSPVTYPLLDLLGGIRAVPGLIAHFITGRLVFDLFRFGGAYIVVLWVANRYLGSQRRWVVQVLALAILAWTGGLVKDGIVAPGTLAAVRWSGMVLLGAAGVIAAMALLRRGTGPRVRASLALWLLLATCGAWVGYVESFIDHKKWKPTNDNFRMADSVHWDLLASLTHEISGQHSVRVAGQFPLTDLDDFRMAGQRPDRGKPTPGLKRGPKNVVFYVMESVATRYMSLYGSKYDTTPDLIAESKNALVFDRMHVPVANSGNSMLALNMGYYAGLSWHEWIWEHTYPPGITVPQVLKKHGYRSAVISSCNLEYCNGLKFLGSRGYDSVRHFADLQRNPDDGSAWWGVNDGLLVDAIVDYAKADRSKPFYAFCWNQQTHHPFNFFYESDPRYAQEDFPYFDNMPKDQRPWDWWDLGQFMKAVRHNDRQFKRLFDGLRQAGLADDTIVVIIGDHGEAFGEPHNTYGHSGKVYQEDVNIPCIFWSPSLFNGVPRSQTMGRIVNLPATILDLLNIDLPSRWQGRSLFGAAPFDRAYFYGSRENYLLGLRDGNMKYMLNVTDDVDELYDLSTDRDEQKNIASAHPDLCRRYRQRLAAWLRYQMDFYAQQR